jgi:hypothetical protein
MPTASQHPFNYPQRVIRAVFVRPIGILLREKSAK